MKSSGNKHVQLVQQLRELVYHRSPGDRLENDRELAARFGVSNVTLRTAMLELVSEGMIYRKVGSGTYVARQQIQQHIAIVVSQELLQCMRTPYAHLSTMSILDELNHHSTPYKLYLIPRTSDSEDCPLWPQKEHIDQSGLGAAIDANEVKALVSISIGRQNGWMSQLEERGVPVIGLSGDNSFKHRIHPTNGPSLREAVRYLSRFGRKRIGLIYWYNSDDPYEPKEDHTQKAFLEEMDIVGLPVYPEWIKNDADPQHSASGWQLFREIWFADPEKQPDALIFGDDRLFCSASSAILEMGVQVPRDLQIVTHWNKGSGLLCPFPVARYVFDPSRVGAIVTSLIQKCLENPDLPAQDRVLSADWFTEGQYDESMRNSFIDPHLGLNRQRV
ncbi:substrate-binding domain-containing protein [Puniceicoccus vermicola]|uniref:Substrate-binding domain-containing protein n=1 Tax=Puniceicoccus vermicola TaxID=388746 RepID=A0A7X1E5H4_9BACT|nr:substrate-binding domain-containing protein [Puniceicoccus vermicola]MBC2603650.1 substrate-binding domain-containing protein [Puniceicoccus vermicola]